MELIFVLAIAFIVALVLGKALGFTIAAILALAVFGTLALYVGGLLLKGVIGVASFGISILGGAIVWIIAILIIIALIKFIQRSNRA